MQFKYQVLARLGDDRVLYSAYSYLHGSAERGIRRDTGIIAPRLVSMESILSRLNFKVLPLTVFPINPITWRSDLAQSEPIGPYVSY